MSRQSSAPLNHWPVMCLMNNCRPCICVYLFVIFTKFEYYLVRESRTHNNGKYFHFSSGIRKSRSSLALALVCSHTKYIYLYKVWRAGASNWIYSKKKKIFINAVPEIKVVCSLLFVKLNIQRVYSYWYICLETL